MVIEIGPIFGFFFTTLATWWWVFPPFLLYKKTLVWWLWWRQDIYSSKQESIMLEIRMPSEVEKPFRAMENVFSSLIQMHDPPDFKEKWFEGKSQWRLAIEIVSFEGSIHFYLRIRKPLRKFIESAIYSQYPNAEIFDAEDYAKKMPSTLPNKEWEIWGTALKLGKPDIFSIKTYSQFFEESVQTKEEKRIDPMSALMEGLATIGQGEQLWMQILIKPPEDASPLPDVAKEYADKMYAEKKAGKKKKGATFFDDTGSVMRHLLTGQAPEQAKESSEKFSLIMLSPQEDQELKAIAEKSSKPVFHTSIRFLYAAKRENYFGPAKAIPLSYFRQFATENLNTLKPLMSTFTKSSTVATWYKDERITYLKKRRLFRNYVLRVPPLFPHSNDGVFFLNIEELATIFHFMGQSVLDSAMSVPRVESKKSPPPSNLPIE
ncbi:MAG: hypothetical protein Q8P70_02775 [bacterium]|nr:hypothetical protein [bacterium]